ncbi:kinase-like domain-containing protein [Dichotomocladium elegans]|nr:kinase-like domain-containing protein [Dichotomocladium elegans]
MTFDDTHYAVALGGGCEIFTIEKKYKIIRKIGSGAYGTVCSAIDLTTNTVVAIKKCFHIFDKKPTTKRYLREIKLLQHFNGHPRIINLRAMDIVDYRNFNEIYLVQDCCDTTMAEIIHSRTELEPVHYQWFMYQLFTALKFIHSANVGKHSNILVNQNGDIRVCDFGMARGYAKGSSEVDAMNMTHYFIFKNKFRKGGKL